MDPPFADVLSPIVWKRNRLSSSSSFFSTSLPISPYGLFMQIQDEKSINSMVWSSTHTYTKKANSFSLHGNAWRPDRPPENLVCQHSYQYEESTWLRFQVDCHQLNQFLPNVLQKGFLGDFYWDRARIPWNAWNNQRSKNFNFGPTVWWYSSYSVACSRIHNEYRFYNKTCNSSPTAPTCEACRRGGELAHTD